MPRPISIQQLPPHPAIVVPDDPPLIKRMYGHLARIALVTCPICGEVREYPTSTLRARFKEGQQFSGACRSCWSSQKKDRTFRSKKNPEGRRKVATGYIVLTQNAVASEDMPMFNAMRLSAKSVFEHRWVMAKHLGRPLASFECIDHMDGNKANNDITNLRIYLKGNNEPGSGNGYGTYYHEWQMAEARIRELEALIDRIQSYT